ncbi:MAG TPA: response regulator transcription factor [Skermanella sp.]|jgi:DNA-binding NarL/FixJ family response regulator|nr:response regulator transcription factor [Skermanella sp.]
MNIDEAPAVTRPVGNDRIRVLCVDDHVVISMAMRATIDASSDMRCVGCIERADMLVETVAELQPDAVLLDLHMPGREPMAAMRDLIHEHPGVAIIVFSGSDDNETRRTALMAGAWCYLLKGGSGQKILDAIRAAVAQKR